ncbi:NADPH-dependent F420 reductase [Cellulomonas timonensis]|uniref:NADPH-dependent F420 reductase n=1 Tax=Cellulomonas timonensis TaxID=1689271 RepID=UPI000837742F|nr:NADPH-dependent F420 reductase [Cellulomonas timonensis]
MTNLSIIGAGTMAAAIASVGVNGGARVQVLSRNIDAAVQIAANLGEQVAPGQLGDPLTGDIVVLAVPYTGLSQLVEQYTPELGGKTLVDICNPIDLATLDGLVVPQGSSAAEQVAVWAPDAHVLKAFNTTFAATLESGTVGGLPTTVLVAGDDPAAKRQLTDLLDAAGLVGLDAGGLSRAQQLEQLGFLQISLATAERIRWTGGFAVVR